MILILILIVFPFKLYLPFQSAYLVFAVENNRTQDLVKTEFSLTRWRFTPTRGNTGLILDEIREIRTAWQANRNNRWTLESILHCRRLLTQIAHMKS